MKYREAISEPAGGASATLIIGDWHSSCSGCGSPANWRETHHASTPGAPQGQACGARFTAARHADGRGKEDIINAMRPDLPTA